MTDGPEKPRDDMLEYRQPERKEGRGCLVLSILVAAVCGLISAGAVIGIAGSGAILLMVVGLVIPVGMIAGALALRGRARSAYYPALAITIISIATAMLLFGLCAGSIDLRGI